MHLVSKKLKFFAIIIVFLLSSQTRVAAQTTEMTKRPLPKVPQHIKTAIGTYALAQGDEQDAGISNQEQEIEQITQENIATYNINVDTKTIQETWLGWINYERSTKGLAALELDEKLNNSSIEWADSLAEAKKFTKMHQRPGQVCKNYRCYDLDNWFSQRGIVGGAESVLYGGYSCKSENCTQDFIETTRGRTGGPSGFLGFLLGEKRSNGVHYRMMMSPSYTKLGVGFATTTHNGFGGAYISVLHYSQ